MRRVVTLLVVGTCLLGAHAGHPHAPPEARLMKSPIASSPEHVAAGKVLYEKHCAECHGADGKAHTPLAGRLQARPTDLSSFMMESRRDGEIYWVITHGIGHEVKGYRTFWSMPPFADKVPELGRWELVQYVRDLRAKQRATEKARLGPYEWDLPAGLPFPNVPADNPMTAEKVELGRHLFYDRRLSLTQTQSCATCHQQKLAFTDGKARGVGCTGEMHPRGPMSLVNVAYSPVLTWANPNMRRLEDQALVPLFGEDPVELGMSGKEDMLAQRLKSVRAYRKMFAAAFPGDRDPFTVRNLVRAIASFERTILSGDSPYDRYQSGDDPQAISAAAKRGESLFFSERLECFHCHGGFNFTGTIDYLDKGFAEVEFHNTGLYNLKARFSYPQPNLGLYLFTHREEDVGKFKAPTLRNIAVTAPYMHDGSVGTLEAAIDHYSSGGRAIQEGAYAGDGAANPHKSQFVKAFALNSEERADLLAFLRSLTDERVLTDAKLSDPWHARRRRGTS